jgi:hypothetical protein
VAVWTPPSLRPSKSLAPADLRKAAVSLGETSLLSYRASRVFQVGPIKKPFVPSTDSLDNLEEVDELQMPNSSPLASLPSRSRPRSARFLRKKEYE